MTRCTPSCSSTAPCCSSTALAQITGTCSWSSRDAVRIDAVMSLPIERTTRSNSPTASCRSTSSRVESALTTCVSSPLRDCTMSSSASMPRTSVPDDISSSAREVPKRPRPITATESASAMRRASGVKERNLVMWCPCRRAIVQGRPVSRSPGVPWAARTPSAVGAGPVRNPVSAVRAGRGTSGERG